MNVKKAEDDVNGPFRPSQRGFTISAIWTITSNSKNFNGKTPSSEASSAFDGVIKSSSCDSCGCCCCCCFLVSNMVEVDVDVDVDVYVYDSGDANLYKCEMPCNKLDDDMI